MTASRLILSFFGRFQATLDNRPIIHFHSANNQGLLAYLALQSERAFSRESLAALLWPEESDHNARRNLRQSLYQLRRLLGDPEDARQTGRDARQTAETARPPYLLVDRQSAQFNPDSDYSLDVRQFLRAVEAGDLQAAAALYLGDLLPGFTRHSAEFEDWLRQEREHLHHLALEALSELAQEQLRRGRPAEAQQAARRQLSLESWRESACRQLMQALALSGDRGGALAQYDACRQTLWQELGIEPAPETTALYNDIRAGRYGALPSEELLPPPERARHNLPAGGVTLSESLVGRRLEQSDLTHSLIEERRRLVTIVGPGGIGKTHLALAAGATLLDHFPDGVWFVDLAPLVDPAEIPPAVSAALGYRAAETDQPLWSQLLHYLSRRQLLLILDNFEQLVAGAGRLTELLQKCPHISLLVTSRQRLNLSVESRYELGCLAIGEARIPADALQYTAVQLFLEHGRRVLPHFALTEENLGDVLHICRLVEGMPLGLLLAAAWLELLSPAEIATEMARSLDFLAADLADLPPRQRSMQAVFAHSWQLMSAAEQQVMARLSIFCGGFTRRAAEQVAGANLRLLLALVDKSLLQRPTDGGRFAIHELLRQFAADKRRQLDPSDETGLAHCRYFVSFIDDESRRLGHSSMVIPGPLAEERENIRLAWAFGLERGLAVELDAMFGIIQEYAWTQGVHPHATLEQALQSVRRHGTPADDPTVLNLELQLLIHRIRETDYATLRTQALDIIERLPVHAEPAVRFRAYSRMAQFYQAHQGFPQALPWREQALQVALEAGDEDLLRQAELWLLTTSSFTRIMAEGDRQRLEELLARLQPDYPNSNKVYFLLSALSRQCAALGDHPRALHFGRRALNIAKAWRDLFMISEAASRLKEIFAGMGDKPQARRQLLDVLAWHLAVGQEWQTLGCLWGIADGHSAWVGGAEPATAIFGMVFHHPDCTPYFRRVIEQARPCLEAELGPEAYAAAWQRGKEQGFEGAVSLAWKGLAGEFDHPGIYVTS